MSWTSEAWSFAIVPKLAGDGGGALNPLSPAQYDWKPSDLVMIGEYGDGSGESGQSAGSGGQKSPRKDSLTRLTVWTPALLILEMIGWWNAQEFPAVLLREAGGICYALKNRQTSSRLA